MMIRYDPRPVLAYHIRFLSPLLCTTFINAFEVFECIGATGTALPLACSAVATDSPDHHNKLINRKDLAKTP